MTHSAQGNSFIDFIRYIRAIFHPRESFILPWTWSPSRSCFWIIFMVFSWCCSVNLRMVLLVISYCCSVNLWMLVFSWYLAEVSLLTSRWFCWYLTDVSLLTSGWFCWYLEAAALSCFFLLAFVNLTRRFLVCFSKLGILPQLADWEMDVIVM